MSQDAVSTTPAGHKAPPAHLAIGIGVVLLALVLVLSVLVREPSDFQIFVFRVTLAIGAAAVGVVLPGFLHLEGKVQNLAVRSGGAIALFVIVYSLNPPSLIKEANGPVPPKPVVVVADSTKKDDAAKPAAAAVDGVAASIPANGFVAPGRRGPAGPVEVVRARASSYLMASRVAEYTPEQIADGMFETAWVENMPGTGEGEWVRLDLEGPVRVTGLRIANGYAGDGTRAEREERFRNNGRVETLVLEFSDGSKQRVHLDDVPRPQAVRLQPVETSFIHMTIESIYPGERWQDTGISEVQVLATAPR